MFIFLYSTPRLSVNIKKPYLRTPLRLRLLPACRPRLRRRSGLLCKVLLPVTVGPRSLGDRRHLLNPHVSQLWVLVIEDQQRSNSPLAWSAGQFVFCWPAAMAATASLTHLLFSWWRQRMIQLICTISLFWRARTPQHPLDLDWVPFFVDFLREQIQSADFRLPKRGSLHHFTSRPRHP